MHIFVTGGLGYIGSHNCVVLLQSGHEVTIFDNLENSYLKVLSVIETITGKKPNFIEGDIRDYQTLERVFSNNAYDAVIHFAGLKAVAESQRQPLRYYDYNVLGSLNLLKILQKFGPKKLIFSSSATVYGVPQYLPYDEEHPLSPNNIYGQTKLSVEGALTALAVDPSWQISILRYFNPVGAHESGLLGEFPRGTPNNLMPFVAQAACGMQQALTIYGQDYDTKDGTAIRDYIHVMDLVEGHEAALTKLQPGVSVYNLGCGVGRTVLEIITAFEESTGVKVPYHFGSRRTGDLPAFYASCAKAETELSWKAKRSLACICQDMWRFQQNLLSLK